jgi:hypothetical protein
MPRSGARASALILIHDSHHEVSSGFESGQSLWSAPAERSGDGALGHAGIVGSWRTTGRDLRQSGVTLRLPPHSIMSGISRTSQSRTDSCELRIRMRASARSNAGVARDASFMQVYVELSPCRELLTRTSQSLSCRLVSI